MGVIDAFFGLLDACVTADQGPAGLRGRIGIGVLGARAAWWVAEFGDTLSVHRLWDVPEGCDGALVVDEATVARFLAGRATRIDTLQSFGDAALLARFASRFIDRQDAIGLRVRMQR